jgi:hypothetical protein
MKWEGYVVGIGEKRSAYRLFLRKQEERDH